MKDMDNYSAITLIPVMATFSESFTLGQFENVLDTDNLQLDIECAFFCPHQASYQCEATQAPKWIHCREIDGRPYHET